MKKILNIFIIALLVLITHTANSQTKKYSNYSGKISYNIFVNDFSAKQNLYFDDYGKNNCIEVNVEVAGQKSITRTFNTDKDRYTVDMVNKKYSTNERLEEAVTYNGTDFDYYLENGMATKLDQTESFLGKDCEVYVMINENVDSKFWVWDNLVLKMTAVTSQAKVIYEAIDIELSTGKSTMYDEYFQIPVGFVEQKF